MTRDEVMVRRTFNVSSERLFAALTDPRELVQWWGPRGIRTSIAEIDLQPGGRCRWVMHPDGEVAVLHGTVLEVDPPFLLSMTNQWDGQASESIVTFRLRSHDGRTELEIHHQRLPHPPGPDAYREGWSAALDSLARHVHTKENHMTTDETRSVAQAYFKAWSTGQGADALTDLMAENFTFRAGEMAIEGRDAFLTGGGWPDRAETTLVAEAYDGDTGIQIYDATNAGVTVRIADQLTVNDGRITSAEVVCDGSQFQAFMSAE